MFTTSVCVSSKDALNSSVFSWRLECLLHQCVCLQRMHWIAVFSAGVLNVYYISVCVFTLSLTALTADVWWSVLVVYTTPHLTETKRYYSTVQSTTWNSTETLIKETRKTTRPKQSRMMYSLSINSNFVLVWPWTLTFCVMLRHNAIYCHCEVWFGGNLSWDISLKGIFVTYFSLKWPWPLTSWVTLTFDLLSDPTVDCFMQLLHRPLVPICIKTGWFVCKLACSQVW